MKRLLLFALLVTLTGCSIFSRSKPSYVTLESVEGDEIAASATPLAIDTLTLPPGLDRRSVVVATGEGKVEVRGGELWLDLLENEVLHTLLENLGSRIPSARIVFPGHNRPRDVRAIEIAFERFMAGPGNEFRLDAQWSVAGGASRRERIVVPLSSLEGAEVARGASQALGQLADRIAAGL